MRTIALFMALALAAQANVPRITSFPYPTPPADTRIVGDDYKVIDGGRRIQHTVRYRNGKKVRFIFDVPGVK